MKNVKKHEIKLKIGDLRDEISLLKYKRDNVINKKQNLLSKISLEIKREIKYHTWIAKAETKIEKYDHVIEKFNDDINGITERIEYQKELLKELRYKELKRQERIKKKKLKISKSNEKLVKKYLKMFKYLESIGKKNEAKKIKSMLLSLNTLEDFED